MISLDFEQYQIYIKSLQGDLAYDILLLNHKSDIAE
jgi:hypothetical protein